MLPPKKRISSSFLILCSLPTAAVGFFLSTITASLSWILSSRHGLHIDNIALIWLAGSLSGAMSLPALLKLEASASFR